MIGVGMVPLFEENQARLERNYKIDEWYALSPMERAIIIAVRRLEIASKNIQADMEIEDAKRKARQATKGKN